MRVGGEDEWANQRSDRDRVVLVRLAHSLTAVCPRAMSPSREKTGSQTIGLFEFDKVVIHYGQRLHRKSSITNSTPKNEENKSKETIPGSKERRRSKSITQKDPLSNKTQEGLISLQNYSTTRKVRALKGATKIMMANTDTDTTATSGRNEFRGTTWV